jgi:hypothetical protein
MAEKNTTESFRKVVLLIHSIFTDNGLIRPITSGVAFCFFNGNKSVVFEFYKNRWCYRRYFSSAISKGYLPLSKMKAFKQSFQCLHNWLYKLNS